jgi:phenylacetate-CoA ligase
MKTIHVDLKNKYYVDWMLFLKNSVNWTKAQIEEYELSQIRKIVKYAYDNTTGYRKLYDIFDIHPKKINSLEDFRKIPYIEKEYIRDDLESFSIKIPERYYVTTGGSTGIPTGMYRTPASFGKELASKAHQYYRIGWKEGDRQMVFRGLLIDTPDHMQFAPEFNELRCSSYQLVPEWMEQYIKRASEYKPEWLRCYPSSGYVFACYIKDHKKTFPYIKGILCASEHLYDFQKTLLSEVFEARVFSHYGHYEMAVIAGYCEYEDTYHVLPQYGFAELIGKDGKPVTKPGEVGEIVATSFIMDATPFVRYKTQDLAMLKGWHCSSCGRPYQIWQRIEGRLQELIVTRSGLYISTSMVNMHDDFYDHIKQFQFVQEEKGKLIFKFIPKESCNTTILQDLKNRLLRRLHNDIELIMEKVDEISLTKRGKHRLLIQKLKLKYDDPSLSTPLRL